MLRYDLVPLLTWRWRAPLAALCVIVSGVGFFIWAPWSSAISRQECEERHNHVVPPDWPAVIINHGQYLECQRGLPKDHPIAFGLFGMMYFGGGIALLFIVGKLRWLQKRDT